VANPNHNKRETPKRDGGAKASLAHKGRPPKTDAPSKDVGFPGVPGQTQPRNRSAGVKKLRQSMKEEGI
jgi:hypothetical protein